MGQEKTVQSSCLIEYTHDYKTWVQVPNRAFGPPDLRIKYPDGYIAIAIEADGHLTIRTTRTNCRMMVEPLANNSIALYG